ncbi:efflux transporter outer membrane subunit [Novosphingopyxis baekryungensis]|uniref:efflux transporter outer membrane subunit n=1 Tax=Novosphingopyxis baekryungensis TaxID=279369 RepID=UPI0003B547A4|nr:efflux transporter outer membrane subunit [Novosphingopyxis baekryungensis]
MKNLSKSLLLGSLALSACTVGPDYAPPETALPPAFSGPVDPSTSGEPVDLAAWWKAYDDPQLSALIDRALADSPDIAIALSRVRQARLQEVAARTRGLPSLSAQAGVSHVELSKNAGLANLARAFSGGGGGGDGTTGGGGVAPNGLALPGTGITTYSAGFDAGWELDLFGGARRGVEGAQARSEAMVWNARDAAVMLAGEVAQAYFALRFDAQQLAVIDAEIAAQQRIVAIAGHNADVGLSPRIDAINARSALNAAQARMAPIRADMVVRRHAIAILLGQQPSALDEQLQSFAAPLVAAPVVPPGLPSDLLRRRPDIRAAERNLAASSADIGVAVADLYPKFNLTGMAQLISTALTSLISGDSLQLTGSALGQFPVFDFGRSKAAIGQREAARDEAYLQYRKTVLGALRDVEDPLAQIDGERRRNGALAQAVADADANAKAMQARYATGFVAEDEALRAQAMLLAAQEQLAASDAQLRQYSITLFKALGGGWEGMAPLPDQTMQEQGASAQTGS